MPTPDSLVRQSERVLPSMGTIQLSVLGALDARGARGATVPILAADTGLSPAQVQRALTTLREAGHVFPFDTEQRFLWWEISMTTSRMLAEAA